MGTPFLSEIRIMSFNFAPQGWALCNGQTLPINQNQALFALLGTTYGGNGQTTFQLPNLRGRVPVHMGSGFTLGQQAGTSSVTVNIQQMPQHVHFLQGTNAAATLAAASGNLLGSVSSNAYITPTNLTTLQPSSVSNVGGNQAHENRQPFSVLNFCIALVGIFPSQN
ncbi:MAG TPA: tail fiber protein [Candidatus Limnocylindria bacterium]|nr:tail fiber protein [Candidatus Limnocylindria bacterium]